jgi:DNA-binding beta-propeller fold protein YncE
LVRTLSIDGDRPKALAVSPDGRSVYVAIFESGNGSTMLAGDFSSLNSFPPPNVVDFPDGPHRGLNPPPNSGTNLVPSINPEIPATNPPPRGGLIVKKNDAGRWMDDNNGDWTAYVSGTNSFFTGRPRGWDTSDNDLAVIETSNLSIRYVKRLMNICMGIGVNPATRQITLVGIDGSNEVRFEPVLKSIFVKANVAFVSSTGTNKFVKDLNPHLDYKTVSLPPSRKRRSIGDPRGILWNAAGTRAYVAGMGSNNILVLDSDGAPIEPDPVVKVEEGPVGLALDEPRRRLYVLNRFANSISVIDTDKLVVISRRAMYDPTPALVKAGRKHFYNTQETSGLGQVSCASCHIDGRFDRLAWDLGDPTGRMQPVTVTNRNFSRFPPGERRDFHPMKGPMVTQSLVDIIGHEPFHWRGDRDGIEQFNGTFTNLQGAASSLTTEEMKEFKEFLASIHFPPNPFRTFNNGLPGSVSLAGFPALGHRERPAGGSLIAGSPQAGMNLFRQQGPNGCIHCHSLPTGLGPHMTFTSGRWRDLPSGPNGERNVALIGVRRSGLLPFKIPSLRNLADKVGLSYQTQVSRSGFGLLHDGSVDSLVRFVQDGLDLGSDLDTANVIAFLLCLTGSDLPQGLLTDPDRPIGVESKDAHAAVGKQTSLGDGFQARFLSDSYALVKPATSRVDLVAHGYKEGVPRGWVFDRAIQGFRSDRVGETLTPAELEALSTVESPITFTVVTRGAGTRLGIDRDLDGFPDRTELDSNADPMNPFSIPIILTWTTTKEGEFEFSWRSLSQKRYRLQFKDQLSSGSWSNLGAEILASATRTTTKLPFPIGQRERYYRIVEVDQ